MADHSQGKHGASGVGTGRWVFLGFVLIAAYFLITEHRAHVFQYLPFLLVLACPLMHLFHGHGSHGGHEREETTSGSKNAGGEKKHAGGCH